MVRESPNTARRAESAATDDAMLRLPAVLALTGQGKSQVYAWVKAGTFPAPVKLSRRCVVWSRNAVQAWIQARLAEGGAK